MAKMTVSKSVENRRNSSTAVHTAHADGIDFISKYFDANYGPGIGDHVQAILTPLMEQLVVRTAALNATNELLVTERNEGTQTTAERDLISETCRQQLVSLRSTLLGMFGSGYLTSIGMGGTIPDRPESVLSVASYVIDRVSKAPAPKNLLADTGIDHKALISKLVEPTEKLKAAMYAVSEEKRQSDGAQLAKDGAIAEFDRVFVSAAGLLSTFLEVSGQTDRARRVRPSTRRPGTTIEIANEELDPANPEPNEPVDGPTILADG